MLLRALRSPASCSGLGWQPVRCRAGSVVIFWGLYLGAQPGVSSIRLANSLAAQLTPDHRIPFCSTQPVCDLPPSANRGARVKEKNVVWSRVEYKYFFLSPGSTFSFPQRKCFISSLSDSFSFFSTSYCEISKPTEILKEECNENPFTRFTMS